MKLLKTTLVCLILVITISWDGNAANINETKEQKLGNSKHSKLIHFADGMFYDDCSVFEMGQLIKVKKNNVQVQTVNLYLFDSPQDSMTFLIRFYKYQNGQPRELIYDKQISQTHALKEGWLSMDLSKYNLNMTEDFVVSLEVQRAPEQPRAVNYEVKLLGGTKSFYRKEGQSEWKRPPHHYCMYVDALVE